MLPLLDSKFHVGSDCGCVLIILFTVPSNLLGINSRFLIIFVERTRQCNKVERALVFQLDFTTLLEVQFLHLVCPLLFSHIIILSNITHEFLHIMHDMMPSSF